MGGSLGARHALRRLDPSPGVIRSFHQRCPLRLRPVPRVQREMRELGRRGPADSPAATRRILRKPRSGGCRNIEGQRERSVKIKLKIKKNRF